MRILAVDYGLARTGIAVSDETCTIATPLECIPSRNEDKLLEGLVKLIDEIKPSRIIMGLPIRTDLKESDMAAKVRAFAERITEATGIVPELKNEMYTTVIASKRLHENEKNAKKQRGLIDSAAAAVLLQEILDKKL